MSHPDCQFVGWVPESIRLLVGKGPQRRINFSSNNGYLRKLLIGEDCINSTSGTEHIPIEFIDKLDPDLIRALWHRYPERSRFSMSCNCHVPRTLTTILMTICRQFQKGGRFAIKEKIK